MSAVPDRKKQNAEAITGRPWETLTPGQQSDPLAFMPDGSALPPGASSLVDHDFWGTPPEVAAAIVDVLGPRLFRSIPRDCIEQQPDGLPYLIEPTAGYGAFVEHIEAALATREQTRPDAQRFNLIGLDDATQCYGALCERFPDVEIMEADFLDAAHDVQFWGRNNIALGNPPFRQARDLQFVDACKRICCRFALILPLTLLEPCENRSWTVQTARYRAFRQGLTSVYPIRRVSFVNLLGGPSTAGKRPVGVFYYERDPRGLWTGSAPGNTSLNYSIQDRLDAGAESWENH